MVQAFNAAGWPLVVTSGYRSQAHQTSLIKQGLTTARRSRHNAGTAFDVSFLGYSRDDALRLPGEVWRVVGEYGEALGLRWGGRFSDYDPFHFDAG